MKKRGLQLGFGVLGGAFRVWGFWDFRVLGVGVRGFRVLGFGVSSKAFKGSRMLTRRLSAGTTGPWGIR